MNPTKEDSSPVLRRLGRNVTILSGGTAAIAMLGIATLTLNTRALGPAQFGLLVLLQSYVVIFGRIFSFDTWQAIIKFGAEKRARNDIGGLRAVASFAMIFDTLSMAAAGSAAVLLLLVAPERFGLSAESLPAALVYTSTLFLQLPGAPIGLMRLFDRFAWLTAVSVGEAALRFAASAALFATHRSVGAYLYAFAAVLVAGNLVRIALSVRLLRRAAEGRVRAPVRDMRKVARAFVRFSAGSWVTGTLNVTRRDGTTLIVAALLGPAATGLYGFAVRIARPIRDFAELLRQAIFPDMSRLIADSRHSTIRRLVKRVVVLTVPAAAAVALVGVLLADEAIQLFAGAAYSDAYWPLVFLIVAAALYLCMPLLSSLVILYAGMRVYTFGSIAAGMIWALVVVWPMLWFGIEGAAVGELSYVLAWLAINLWLLARTRHGTGRRERGPGATSS